MAIQTKYQITADVSSFDRAMADIRRNSASAGTAAKKAFAGVSSSILSSAGSLSSFAGMLGPAGAVVGGITALGSAVGSAFGTIKDFEKATSNLAGVLGTTPAAIADLTDQAKLLGSTTAFTASQVTQLQTELAKLGFNQTEIKQSTDAVLKLSAATGAELGDAASLAGATLRAFNMDASEMSRVTSVLAVSTTKSALDFGKLQTSMAIVSPVAKSFGFSIEDTVAMLGKLSDAGFDASSAATATRNILLNLANENGKLARALGRPVRNAGELGAALAELRDKGVSLNEALEMTDKRSVAAFEAFMTQAEGIGKLSKELTGCNDALDTMVDTMTDNLQGSVDNLSSAWEGLMLAFSASKGVFRDIIDGLTSVVRTIQVCVEGIDGAMKRLEQEGQANFDKIKEKPEEMRARLEKEVASLAQSNPSRSEGEIRKEVYNRERERLAKELATAEKTAQATKVQQEKINKLISASNPYKDFSESLKEAGMTREEYNALLAEFKDVKGNSNLDSIRNGLKERAALNNVDAYSARGKMQTFETLTKPQQAAPVQSAPEETFDDESIEGLRKHIQALKKERDGLNWKTDAAQISAYTGKIKELQDKLNELTGVSRKSSQAVKEIGEVGSLSYAKNELEKANKDFEMASDENGRQLAATMQHYWAEVVAEIERKPLEIDVEAKVQKVQSAISSAPMEADVFGTAKGAETMYNEYSSYISRLQSEFESLGATIDAAFDGGADITALSPLMEQYDELGRHIEDATAKAETFRETVSEQREAAKAVDETQKSVYAVGSAFDAMSSFGGDAFQNIMGGISELISAVGKLIPVLMAQSMASSTAKVASTSATWYEILPGIAAVTAAIGSIFSSLKYAEGGIVGGSHYNADRVPALVESGEMILNKRQQRNLFAVLDGGAVGGSGGSSVMRLSGRDLVATIKTQNSLTAKLK